MREARRLHCILRILRKAVYWMHLAVGPNLVIAKQILTQRSEGESAIFDIFTFQVLGAIANALEALYVCAEML